MKLKPIHWIGIGLGLAIIIADFIIFLNQDPFLFVFGIGIASFAIPFVIDSVIENNRNQEIGEMFLEFARNLAEGVKSGTPISKSIINLRRNNYGPLSPYVEKLANQLDLGLTVDTALKNFAYEVNNPVVNRAIELISEAEKAGGEIEYILEAVASSIAEVEKLKKERKAAISTLIVQGYIIFFIFIAVMLIMEFKILPLTTQINFGGSTENVFGSGVEASLDPAKTAQELARPFLYLLVTQGFFAGLTIGKLSEGTLNAGIKHSFILAISALLISTGVELLVL